MASTCRRRSFTMGALALAGGALWLTTAATAQYVLPTYDHVSTPFPRSPLVQPAEVVRFRPAQFMTTLYVDKEQLDAVLEPAGWASSGIFDAHDDPRLTGIQAYWEFRNREHFQGVKDSRVVGGSTIYGPSERFYLGAAAVSLADPTIERYLFLIWVDEHADTVLRQNEVFGRAGAKVAHRGTVDLRLRCRPTRGENSILLVSLRVTVHEVGFSFSYCVRLPSDAATRQIADDPIGLSGALLDTATGKTGPTYWMSDRSAFQRFFAGESPGFQRKLPANQVLRLPGGWTIDVRDFSDRFDYYIDVESHIRREQ